MSRSAYIDPYLRRRISNCRTMKTYIKCIFSFLLIILLVLSESRQFRCDYKYFSSTEGWLKVHIIPANWHDARLRCHLEGANLASPLNSALKESINFVMAANNITCGIFSGIHATFSRGDFFSIEGEPLGKIPHMWAKGEPDNYNDVESCVVMMQDGTIADVNCADTYPYVCYKKKTTSVVTTSCGTIDTEYTLDTKTGSCYKFHKVPRSWSRAYMACAAEGGYLAILNSETEAKTIRDLFVKYPPNILVGNFIKDFAFLGIHDWNEHGDWLTVHGQTLQEAGYDKFSNGEPNNSTTGEFCGVAFRTGLYGDFHCEGKCPFICEKSPDSLLCDEDEC